MDVTELFVDERIEHAETLPPRAFTDGAVLERELERIFDRRWLLIGDAPPIEALSVRGARYPVEVVGRPLFLQRGWDDDALRCFPNVCTHAWYPLVRRPGAGPSVVCEQHGRTFDCQGRFKGQLGFAELPGFPRRADHLCSLPVVAWRGLAFVCLGEPAGAFEAPLAPVDETLAALPPLRPLPASLSVRRVAGNWKQHAWNYLDRFHIASIHGGPDGLARAIDRESYRTELHPAGVLQWAYARDPADGFDPALLPTRFRDPGGRRVFALWWFLFPNVTLNYYPWGLSVNVYEPLRRDPTHTRFTWVHHVLDDALYAQRDARWLISRVDAEDLDAMAEVRRGLTSGFAVRGRFAPGEEAAPHWFHRRVAEALA